MILGIVAQSLNVLKDVEFELMPCGSKCNDSFSQVQEYLYNIFLLYNVFLQMLRLYFSLHRMCGSESLFSSLIDNDFQRFRVKKICSGVYTCPLTSSQVISGLFTLFRPHNTQTQSSVLLIQPSSAI